MEFPLVQLTKLRVSPNAACPSGNWAEYRLGAADNSTSLPVDYVLVGYLVARPQSGQPVKVLRISRNDVVTPGLFVSTVVQQLTNDGFVTENSVYRLEFLDENRAQLFNRERPSSSHQTETQPAPRGIARCAPHRNGLLRRRVAVVR